MARIEKKTKRCPSDLIEADWAAVAPLPPLPARKGRRRSGDLREILNAIRYRARAGCEGRMLSAHLPPWRKVSWSDIQPDGIVR